MSRSKGNANTSPKTLIWRLFGLSALIAAAAYVISLFAYCDPIASKSIYCPKLDGFGKFFNDNIRASLFAGFLSLGGFLLSLKTFIIVNMKKDVYDSPKYGQTWEAHSKLGAVGRKYDPLRELSAVLFAAILTAILTAILQITVGLHQSFGSSFICLWSATFATILLVKSLFLIRSNLKNMFDYLDD